MLFAEFIKWYYHEAPIQIAEIWRNFLTFPFNIFGIRYHLATFFRPWHLVAVRFEDTSLIRKFLWNLSSRVVGSLLGAFMRGITIMIGFVSAFLVFFIGIFFLLLWLFLPLILGYAFFESILLLL